jgi:unsaturated chondroitin disaccharide hydrolase
VCHWDLYFTSGSHEKDSSAAAIAACGLLELAKSLPGAERNQYDAAAWSIVNALSRDHLADTPGANGVLGHAVYHMPNRVGVNESCIWGDYFYSEALVRLTRDWRPYW